MKATKLIKKAIESRLGLTEKEYDVLHMAHMYGERHSTYDVALINEIPTCNAFIIRVWQNGGMKIRQVTDLETYEEAFISFLTLKE